MPVVLFNVLLNVLKTGKKYRFGSSRFVPVIIFIAQSDPRPMPVKRNNLNLLIVVFNSITR